VATSTPSDASRSSAPPDEGAASARAVLRRRSLSIDEDRVREWLDAIVELVEVREFSAKTVNNDR
jgi:hypothetical protein